MTAKPKKKKEAGSQREAGRAVSQNGHLEKPPVHTNRMGSQSVRAIDIIKSKVGKKAIDRLSEAHLVEEEQIKPDEQDDAAGA